MAKRKRLAKIDTPGEEPRPKRRQHQADQGGVPSNSGIQCRLLSMPAELRNEIYGMVIEEVRACLTKRGTLACNVAIMRVNRQLREEVAAVIPSRAQAIRTVVEDFNFAHLITFINRMTDIDIHHLSTASWHSPCHFLIDFTIPASGPFGCQSLDRWLKRVEHPTKRGTAIDVRYQVLHRVGSQGKNLSKFSPPIRDWRHYLRAKAIVAKTVRAKEQLDRLEVAMDNYLRLLVVI